MNVAAALALLFALFLGLPAEAQVVPDLSGTWVSEKEEWKIAHQPRQGTVVLRDPITHRPGRYLEFRGTVKDGIIAASSRIGDPDVLNPRIPEKVRREDASTRPTWRLRLRLTEDGRLEGTYETRRVAWDTTTFKITSAKPSARPIVLVRRGPPTSPTPALGKPGTTKGPSPADGPTVERRADGTEVATWPNGTVIEVHPDGTRVTRLRDGSQFTRQPDGTTITRYADGGEITVLKDGTRIERSASGLETVHRRDGIRVTTFTAGRLVIVKEYPDGTTVRQEPDATETTTLDFRRIERRRDGTTVERWADEYEVIRRPDGTVERRQHGYRITEQPTRVEQRPDGTTVTTRPDGVVTERRPDGTEIIRGRTLDVYEVIRQPDGQWTRYRVRRQTDGTRVDVGETAGRPDGTRIERSRDGTVVERRPDGSTLTRRSATRDDPTVERDERPDGTVISRHSDGSTLEQRPDGTSIHTHPDGTTSTHRPDGTVLSSYADGSESVYRPDGRMITTYPDGRRVETSRSWERTTVFPDGAVEQVRPR